MPREPFPGVPASAAAPGPGAGKHSGKEKADRGGHPCRPYDPEGACAGTGPRSSCFLPVANSLGQVDQRRKFLLDGKISLYSQCHKKAVGGGPSLFLITLKKCFLVAFEAPLTRRRVPLAGEIPIESGPRESGRAEIGCAWPAYSMRRKRPPGERRLARPKVSARAHCPGRGQWASPSIRGLIGFSVGFVSCLQCMKCICIEAAPLAPPEAWACAEERSELPFERGMLESASLLSAALTKAVAVPAPIPVVDVASGGTECDGCL